MNRLQFLWARATGDEAALSRLSAPLADLLAELSGKQVALIGNARSLATTAHGPAIDAAALIIRLNAAPMPSPASHGTRTDWLAMSVPVDAATITARAPARLVWVTPRRRRLPWVVAQTPGFALLPTSLQRDMARTLGARPSTGAMVIALLAQSAAKDITLFGFDFFASLSLSGRRTATEVSHDFAAEAVWFRTLQAHDPRFRQA